MGMIWSLSILISIPMIIATHFDTIVTCLRMKIAIFQANILFQKMTWVNNLKLSYTLKGNFCKIFQPQNHTKQILIHL